MTFSLAVTDPGTGQVGVAAMTAMPGVGKIVAHARTHCGAAAFQAIMNPYLAFDGLALIGQGVPADEALAYLDAREDAGGETQGHRSATVLIMASELYPLWDLRIDDADDPLAHLHEQKETFAQELLPEIEVLPKRTDPLGGVDYRGTGDTV